MRYARNGTLTLSWVVEGARVESADAGPGMRRLMDAPAIETESDGAVIVAVAARPFPGERVSGDMWVLTGGGERYRVALIDALGHGPEAAAVAAVAVAALEQHPELGPVEALHACHRELRGTRGAAISIATIDLAAGMLTYAGVGNVEARLRSGARSAKGERLIAYRGIVGSVMQTVRGFAKQLPDEWLLLLHTDGVQTRFELPSVAEYTRGGMQALADWVLAEWGRETDDATVIAIGVSGIAPVAPEPG